MTTEEAKTLCAKHGSVLRHYETGRVATLVIPSGEVLVVSVGTATAKIFVKRAVVGWLLPKTIGDKNLADWIPEFRTLSDIQRFAMCAMVLDGLVSLAARAKFASELSLAWTVLKNPLEVAFEECGWGFKQVEGKAAADEQGQTKVPIQVEEKAPRSGSVLEAALDSGGTVIISGFRRIAAAQGCAPSMTMSDEKIIEVYSRVCKAFRDASERRGERIPALLLNRIVLYFLQCHEKFPEQFFDEHLRYEVEKYSAEGLRPEYQKELSLFPADAPGAKMSISIDPLARPGALLSGKVSFSDGRLAEWILDEAGRLGLVPPKGYKPPAADLQEFQAALEVELRKLGL